MMSIMETQAPAATDDHQCQFIELSLSHKIPRQPFEQQHIKETVYLEIEQLLHAREQLPGYSSRPAKQWSKNVRLYTLLRMLGHQDGDQVFEKFEREEIGDFWLPLTFPILNQLDLGSGFDLMDFMRVQLLVMSDSEYMDKQNLLVPFFKKRYIPGPRARTHRHLDFTRSHFTNLGEISKGSTAQVLRVQHRLSGEEFAWKRLARTAIIRGERKQLQVFEQEVKVLQSIRHAHIVRLVASFTDLESFSLILDPIADNMLLDLLERKQPLSDEDIAILSCSFNCLATALEFLHVNSIRHKDIKPRNILLSEGRVLLCDFGISLEWSEGENGTTEGGYSSFTRRYAAPEVFHLDASRNKKTDVWSLGCVFLEIVSAIKGYSFGEVDLGEYIDGRGLPSAAKKRWLEKIKRERVDTRFDLAIDWVLAMITDDPYERLEASDIVNRIHQDSTSHSLTRIFLASCCRKPGYGSHFRTSIHSAQTSTPSPEPTTYDNFSPSQSVVSLDRPYQQQSSSSQRSENVAVTARNSSVGSTSIRLPTSQVRRGRGDVTNTPNSALFSSVRTSVGTPGTSLRSDSVCLDNPGKTNPAVQESSDIIMRDMSGAPMLLRGLSGYCNIREEEDNLFEEPVTTFSFAESATAERIWQCCNKSVNTVQVFETPPSSVNGHRSLASSVWKTTRRVVVSDTRSPGAKCCYSFWLPLTDIRFSLHETTVNLKWSDCNQLLKGGTSDHGEHWSWVYDSGRPNNDITIEFCDLDTAKAFLNIVCFPQENSSTLDISNSQEIRTWNNMRFGKESIVSLTRHEESYSDSKLFIIGKCIDLRIERSIPNRQLNVRLDKVSKPFYLSDHIKKPSKGRNRIARFQEAKLASTSLAVSAPLDSDIRSPIPPSSVSTMFHNLTGWRLQYFASAEQMKSEKHAMKRKRYGAADVMLWKKEVRDIVSARITFRLSGEGNIWISGRISSSTTVSSSSKDASCWFDMFGKQHGCLLDTFSMTAVTKLAMDDPTPAGPISGFQLESRRITLRFQDHKHRQKFAELVEELMRSVAKNPPASNVKRSIITGSTYRHVPPSPLNQ